MQETAQINPVVSRAHCDKVAAYLEEARQQKAELISGSAGPDAGGYYIPPTLVVNPDAGLRLSREEVFGPVVNPGASGRWRGGAAPRPTTAILV